MTQMACKLEGNQRLCLTGTPVENHLGEAWSLFTFLMPGLLGDHKKFTRLYRTPIEKQGDTDRKEALAKRLRPFVLRRLKENVAKELPPKTVIVRKVSLNDEQRDLYEVVRHVMNDRVREEIEAKGLARSQIVILDALLKMRQTCCDPRLVKLAAAKKVKNSAKLDELMDMLPTLIEEGRKILLFSQFTSMLDLIKPALRDVGIPFVELCGSTKDRKTPINQFQNGEVPLFLISLKAGGTGLNLTAADTVIHYDPWWNPSVENQATDRAHRIGQDKPVFVYKLIAEGTVEERILELQEKKAGLAEALFGDNPAAAAKLTQDDLQWLME
jgi:SNF2 family DNA or RNA helicase